MKKNYNFINYNENESLKNLFSDKALKNYNSKIFNLIIREINNNDKICDFGAGIGTFSKRFNKKKIICVEADKENFLLLKKTNITYSTLNSLRNNSMDLIYSINVLEHIKDDEKIISLINKKLKKKGKFILFVPAFNFLYSKFDLKVGHFRRYKLNQLKDKIFKKNFSISKISYFDSIGFFLAIIFKYINSPDTFPSVKSIKFYDKYIFSLNTFFDLFFKKILGKNIFLVAIKN